MVCTCRYSWVGSATDGARRKTALFPPRFILQTIILPRQAKDKRIEKFKRRGTVFCIATGGYLGADFRAFFSAVVSGAAGIYVGMLMEDAEISSDLDIQSGQTVRVSGDPTLKQPPLWGTGGFVVHEQVSIPTHLTHGTA